jgi:hypothetical protein
MSMFSGSSYGAAAVFLLAVSLATISCADPPPASALRPVVAGAEPTTGIKRIEQLIGNAACSTDSECRVIGVGAQACGGPEAYRAWSITQTDARALQDTVARDAAARKEEIERAGMLSTCAIKPVPAVSCMRAQQQASAGRCALAPPGGAS